MTLDKAHVARRLLGAALALFLEDLDPIVVHVLACTAGEVAEYLAVKASGQPFTARALATFRNNSWRDIRRARNQFWSSFRYATTHDDDQDGYSRLVSGFSDLQNDHALLVGWYDLMLASKKLPIEAQMFQSWYFALYPERLGSEADVSRYETLFPRLRDLARSDQKNALRDANRTFPTRPGHHERPGDRAGISPPKRRLDSFAQIALVPFRSLWNLSCSSTTSMATLNATGHHGLSLGGIAPG
jgi:hypothetical protein